MNESILKYGAVGDGTTLNTKAIQAAIDCCSAAGGGRVTVPAGKFKTGTIWLKSHVEFYLELGAELLASDDLDDYNALDAYPQNFGSMMEKWAGKHLIIAHEIEDVAITGFGTINGNCHAFVYEEPSPEEEAYIWCYGRSALKDPDKLRPGQVVCFIESKHIRVQDVTFVDAPCWACFLYGCEFAQIRGIKVFNPIWMLNSDGIDIDSSRYVTVSDCIIKTGDDAITLRCSEQRLRNKDIHCEHVTISNCILETGICAFRIGVGYGSIRHARISNIVINQCLNVVQFCTTYNGKGCAYIEDVNFSDISAENTDRCIEAFAGNGSVIKNVTMENIRTTSTTQNFIECADGEIDNITLRNIDISYFDKRENLAESALSYRGNRLLFVKNAKNVTVDGVRLSGTLFGIEGKSQVIDSDGYIQKECNF